MKLFNIYTKKSESNAIEDLILVKNGGSFMAFMFNIFWFLQHKMWKESLLLFAFNTLFFSFFQKEFFDYIDIFLIEFGISLMIALNANYWYEQHLLKHNYQFAGCVFGKNKEGAKLRFIQNCFDSKPKDNIFCNSMFELCGNPK